MILLRALLALGLLVGLYLLCLVLVVVDLGLVVLIVWDSISLGRPLSGGVVMMAMTLIPTFWVLRGLFSSDTGAGPDPHVVPVSPEQVPDLWATVRELAGEVGTRPPSAILLTGEVNAQVAEETRLLGLVGGTRRLYVGLPLLAGLSAGELRAVLCHELGHYAHAHTRLGAVTYRGHLALRATLDRLERSRRPVPGVRGPRQSNVPVSWIWWPFLGYARLYFWLSSAVNRRQELQADAAAARGVGAEVTAEALRRSTVVLPVAWGEFRVRHLDPMRAGGRVPDDALAAFAAVLAAPGYRDRLEELRRFPPSPPPFRYDSHPSLDRRLRALGVPGTADGPAEGRDPVPAAETLARPGPDPGAVRRCLFPGVSGTPDTVPWEEWLESAAEIRATEPVARLVRAAHKVGGSARPALATVLDLLARGRGGRLSAYLADAVVPEEDGPDESAGGVPRGSGETAGKDAREDSPRLDVALFALVGQALVARGRARWEVTWSEEGSLVWSPSGVLAAAGGTVGEIRDLVTAAAGGDLSAVRRLRLRLHALGVDPGARLDQDAEGIRRNAAPVGTISVTPVVDAEEQREGRGQFRIRLAAALLIGGLFLATVVPLPFEREPAGPAGVPVNLGRTTQPTEVWPGDRPLPLPSLSPFGSGLGGGWTSPAYPGPISSAYPLDGRLRDFYRLKKLLRNTDIGRRLDLGEVGGSLARRKRR
ncbi:M48 family metallopeptidase [Streptosporangium sp. NPDC051022]|uniref:M48 family metallopeptidase n=1 Tax=Streptosporangium sp. NPDC051022 TaxID=3155752 RepID=UPI00342A2318